MQFFFTCTKINDKESRDQNSINVKFLIFLYFQYKRMKMKRKTLLCIDRDNQVGYQGKKHPSQGARTIKMKIWWERHHPKIQPKTGFLSSHRHLTITIETQEDSTIIKTYPATIKPNNQATKGDVHGCLGEKHVYTPLAEGQNVYVRDCHVKTRVYVLKHS